MSQSRVVLRMLEPMAEPHRGRTNGRMLGRKKVVTDRVAERQMLDARLDEVTALAIATFVSYLK